MNQEAYLAYFKEESQGKLHEFIVIVTNPPPKGKMWKKFWITTYGSLPHEIVVIGGDFEGWPSNCELSTSDDTIMGMKG